MKIIPYSVLAATLMGGMVAASAPGKLGAAAKDSEAQEETRSKTAAGAGESAEELAAIPAGTTIYAELSKSIDAKRAKVGDEVVARSTLPVLAQGRVAIPNDAKIMGHITETEARSGANGNSRVGILFDHVLFKDGTKTPIALTIQAIGRRPLTAHAEDPGQPGNSEMYPPQPHPTVPAAHGTNNSTPTDPIPHSLPQSSLPEKNPALDAGSHGTIGMPDMTLIESNDAARGSVIQSSKKNVKLESETELLLRILAAADTDATKP